MTSTPHLEPQDLAVLMAAAMEDVHVLGKQLTASDTQVARRALVRATFAYTETMTLGLKRWALEYAQSFSPGELALLREESYDLTGQGEVYVRAAFMESRRNVRFSFKAFARAFATEDVCEVSGKGWQSYQAALKVRHRLMHPKRTEDFEISDAELGSVKEAFLWYHSTLAQALASALRRTDPEAAAALKEWYESGRQGPKPEALARHRPTRSSDSNP